MTLRLPGRKLDRILGGENLEQHYYQIDEVAIKTGLTKRALRYYEDINLLTPSRTEAGYRLYSEEDVAKLIRIKENKESLGFCLNDIKELLELEENLKVIFGKPNPDIDLIIKSLAMIKKVTDLIEKKEQSIARVKCQYQKAFNELNLLYSGLKEGNYQHEKD